MQTDEKSPHESGAAETCLFLQDLCSFICRLHHMEQDTARWQDVRIDREYNLGLPGYSADLRILAPSGENYFIEIKHGQSNDRIIKELGRKYGAETTRLQDARGVILVVDTRERWEWDQARAQIAASLREGLKFQVWDEDRLLSMVHERFGVRVNGFDAAGITQIRNAMEDAAGKYAFGEEWTCTSTQLELLWRFSPWSLRELRERRGGGSDDIVRPGLYDRAVVLLADLCAFQSYTRDTDAATVREFLAMYYSGARAAIHDAGGMAFEFRAERVTGIFGMPEDSPGCISAALECADRLADIGESVCHSWQRHIDRLQSAQGVQVAIALGRMQVIPAGAFDRAHFGVVSDEFAVADRLVAQLLPGEVVVNNSFREALDDVAQGDFAELDPVEAMGLGKIRLWKKIS